MMRTRIQTWKTRVQNVMVFTTADELCQSCWASSCLRLRPLWILPHGLRRASNFRSRLLCRLSPFAPKILQNASKPRLTHMGRVSWCGTDPCSVHTHYVIFSISRRQTTFEWRRLLLFARARMTLGLKAMPRSMALKRKSDEKTALHPSSERR